MSDDRTSLLDDDHTRCLCDVGGDGYIAATAVADDGSTHLLLARVDAIGNSDVTYDPTCQDISHEQLGQLPEDVTRRMRGAPIHRCGRATKTTGRPCRIEVSRRGEPCGLHRTPTNERNHA